MLKTKTIKTDKATVLVVEFPENYRVYRRVNGTVFCSNVRNKSPKIVWDSFRGNWLLIERIPDITEDQSDKVVESEDFKHYSGEYFHMFVDYNNCEHAFDTSVESLSSLLQANEIYFENPFRKPSIYGSWLEDDETIFDGSGQAKECVLYHEAQQKVWDRNRTYIFKQLK